MPRVRIGVQSAMTAGNAGLAEKLAAELKSDRDFGQPLVYEQVYSTKKSRVTVIWDLWAEASLEERTAIILKAYEAAEGGAARDKIALASGLTVPEAAAAGMLPYKVIPALRKSDPVNVDQVKEAMIEQGASTLDKEGGLQLRFATEKEAKACLDRLVKKLPQSEQIWIISRDMRSQEYLGMEEDTE